MKYVFSALAVLTLVLIVHITVLRFTTEVHLNDAQFFLEHSVEYAFMMLGFTGALWTLRDV